MADEMLIPVSLEQAALQLARCKVAASEVGGFHKQADPGQAWWQNPAVQQTLAPVAIGAGVGGLGGLALGARSKRKVNPLWTALSGATIGAAGGGLYAAAANRGLLNTPPSLQPSEVDNRMIENAKRRAGDYGGPALEIASGLPLVGPAIRTGVTMADQATNVPLPANPTPRPPATLTDVGGQAAGLARDHAIPAGTGFGLRHVLKKWHETKEDVNSLLNYTDRTPVVANGKTPAPAAPKAYQAPKGDTMAAVGAGYGPAVADAAASAPPVKGLKYTSTDGAKIDAPPGAKALIDDLTMLGDKKLFFHPENLPVARTAYERAILNKHLNAARQDGTIADLKTFIRSNRPRTSPLQRGVRGGARNIMAFGLPYLIQDQIRKMRGLE